jgi:hypothetical protein
MEFLFNTSPVAKILVVFALILVANRVKIPLGIALILGGIAIDLWGGHSIGVVFTHLLGSLGRPELWLLVLNITLILEFGYFMAYKPNSQAILSASRRLGGRHGRAISLVIMPAAMGLVPMPGGALFSAPMVKETLDGKTVPASWKVTVNYWFRHVFEYWWPLYPVVIVTLSIFTLDTWQFFLLQIPFTLVSLLCGWFFLLNHHLDVLSDETQPERGDNKRLFTVLQPLLVVVLCTLFLPGIMGRLFPLASSSTHKLLAMFVGLVVSLLLIRYASRSDVEFRLFRNILSRKTAYVVFTLGGVMIFQAMLETSLLLPEAGRQLSASMVPIELVIAFLPFLAGLVTGIAIGFAGPAFPLVVGLVAADASISQASALVLAFTMGYAGMMLSPVHLCYILTRRYFSAGLFSSYVYLVPCVLSVAAWGITMHVFLRFMGW